MNWYVIELERGFGYDWYDFMAEDQYEAVEMAKEQYPGCDIQRVAMVVTGWCKEDQDA